MPNTNRTKEKWVDIPDWESYYQVSDRGRVRSCTRRCKTKWGDRLVPYRLMSLVQWGKTNHLGLRLKKHGYSKQYYVHQLVAIAFLGHNPKESGFIIDHVDENPRNNYLSNLMLVTVRYNTSKSIRHKGKSTSKYTGVSWDKKSKKWKAQIVINGKKEHLGFFDNERDASETYKNRMYAQYQ